MGDEGIPGRSAVGGWAGEGNTWALLLLPLLLPPARSGLSGAYKRLRSPSVGAAAILRPKPENGGVELAERALPSPPPALPFSPLCRALPGVSEADVYFSWHALAGAEPQISHIFIG